MKKADGQRIERRKYNRKVILHWKDCVREIWSELQMSAERAKWEGSGDSWLREPHKKHEGEPPNIED